MEQLSLNPPIYRSTDPATSKQAGERKTRSGGRARDQELLLTAIRRWPNQTVTEYADILRQFGIEWWRAVQVASKRLSDLERNGRIVATGTRVCRLTGNKARFWRAL